MAKPENQESKAHNPNHELQQVLNDIRDMRDSQEDIANWQLRVNNKSYQNLYAKEAVTRLSKWMDNGEREDNDLAKVAWFCITQIAVERKEAEV